jgi:hypothetical protein
MTDYPKPHIFGIRHHGPGSARSVLQALEELQPDVILIEGPPDANDFIPFIGHPDMHPPIALLVYSADEPKYAAYYPFAQFSPEYQAIRFALDNAITVRFMDLPVAHSMYIRKQQEAEAQAKLKEVQEQGEKADTAIEPEPLQPEGTKEPDEETKLRHDPLGTLAQAAGYQDGERWWEQMVEHRRDSAGLFEALLEAMTALRDEGIMSNHPMEDLREAYMRKIIRDAQAFGYERIAVICGAWHSPALDVMPDVEADNALLNGLGQMPVDITFTPWTHSRLTMWSGYGAGIWSPGWYQHLWDSAGEHVAISWLTKCAELLRDEDLSASPAQVIDAVRLSEALAAMRQRTMAGLEEFNEASLAVFCFGNSAPLRLIHEKLIVGEIMGAVPDDTPMVPLQRDLLKQERELKLRRDTKESELKLDLRLELHLKRSHLFHRLEILEVQWGKKSRVTGKAGTYHEVWKLRWQPELTIQVIEKGTWGNTVYDASTEYAKHIATEAPTLPHLTHLVNEVLLADLPDAVGHVVRRLQAEAAATGDIKQLMVALPSLADVMTYGNVRSTDVEMVAQVADGMITRTCIGLPSECAMLDDEAAQDMFKAFMNFNSALYLLDNDEYTERWHQVLRQLMEQRGVHGLLRGRSCRILLDTGTIDRNETIRQMRLMLNLIEEPAHAAAWLMGFLSNSGLILIHDDELLTIIDDWAIGLTNDIFEAMLPLLRRTFATFNDPERRQIGKIISGRIEKARQARENGIDQQRANQMLPILAELLGVDVPASADKPDDKNQP